MFCSRRIGNTILGGITLKLIAVVLLMVLFPGVVFGIVLGVLVHPLFFLLLILLFLALPAIRALVRQPSGKRKF